MNNRLFFRYGLILVLALFIFAMTDVVVSWIGTPTSSPQDLVALPGSTSIPGGSWEIQQSELSGFECGLNGEVISALVTIKIFGGVPPYLVQFNSENTVFEIDGVGISFRLPGGKKAKVSMYDSKLDGRNDDTLDVYVPTHHSECEEEYPTDTATVIVDPTFESTVILTSTPSIPPGHFSSPTPTKDTIDLPLPTNSLIPPSPTNSPIPPSPTNSPIPPSPTNSPVPPSPTNAPVPPSPTNAPTPPSPTKTPVPPPPTKTPIPGRPQCDDGIDNDGDTKIDKADPQCHNKHDNDESR